MTGDDVTTTVDATGLVENIDEGEVVTVVYTVSTGGVCPDKTDEVTITNTGKMTKSVIAEDTIKVCLSEGTVNLVANAVNAAAIETEVGTWSGALTAANINSPTTTAPIGASGDYQMKWTISNGLCPVSVDSIIVHVDDVPTVCLLYTSPSPRDGLLSRMPSSA